MTIIENTLGKPLTASQVAIYLGTSAVTVRSNYKKLGGIRLGSRYIFTEKGLINAVLQQDKSQVDRSDKISGKKEDSSIFNKKGGESLGTARKNRGKKKEYIKDKHHLID